jgi:hypothetical protein
MEEGWEQVAQCLGMPLTFPHSERAVPVPCAGWLHSAGLAAQCRG